MKARGILAFALLGACSSAAQSPSGGAVSSDAAASSAPSAPTATAAATSDPLIPKDPMVEVVKVVRPLELDVVLRDPTPGRTSRSKGDPEKKEEKEKGKRRVSSLLEQEEEPEQGNPPAPDSPAPPADGELSASTQGLGSSVDPEALRGVIEENRAIFRACSDANASVMVDFSITPSGEVTEVASSSSEPDDVRLRDCVVSSFRKLRFAPMASTESAKVSLRLALRSE